MVLRSRLFVVTVCGFVFRMSSFVVCNWGDCSCVYV